MQFSHKKPTNGRTIKEEAASFLKDTTTTAPKVFERHGSRALEEEAQQHRNFFFVVFLTVCVLCSVYESILFLNEFCIRNLRASLYFLYKN